MPVRLTRPASAGGSQRHSTRPGGEFDATVSSPIVTVEKFAASAAPRTAEKRDEIAPPHHSIISSARSRIDGGIARPSAVAVLRILRGEKPGDPTDEARPTPHAEANPGKFHS